MKVLVLLAAVLLATGVGAVTCANLLSHWSELFTPWERIGVGVAALACGAITIAFALVILGDLLERGSGRTAS